MCVAEHDVLTPTHLAIAAFARANEPKRLVILPGGHFDAYVAGFDAASGAAADWFTQHLLERGRTGAGAARFSRREAGAPTMSA
jgi:hypothetical protein